jgi:hypothetical protein
MESIPRHRIDEILDQMLNEVNKDYYLAVRKSIIDYALKSED